jgi:hypothetical protein
MTAEELEFNITIAHEGAAAAAKIAIRRAERLAKIVKGREGRLDADDLRHVDKLEIWTGIYDDNVKRETELKKELAELNNLQQGDNHG